MTLSIWRFSHLVLAITASLFIVVASITGAFLAFEPIIDELNSSSSADLMSISLVDVNNALEEHYDEVFSVEIDENRNVIAEVLTYDFEDKRIIVNPITGKEINQPIKQSEFFTFMISLHRSLFLHDLGRVFMGITSIMLLLISISGLLLLLKRKKGWRAFFSKIERTNVFQYLHVLLGKWSLLPIILICLTAIVLFLQHFNFFVDVDDAPIDVKEELIHVSSSNNRLEASVFQNIYLGEVKRIDFPFSEDQEDYFIVRFKDRTQFLHQYTGAVLGERNQSNSDKVGALSLDIHTGRIHFVWAILLFVVCINLLFFIYSGFRMTFKRRKYRWKNKFKRSKCAFVIGVGTETGTTKKFAIQLQQTLQNQGLKVYVTDLNNCKKFKSLKELIVLTSTYGDGEAPANATRFIDLIMSENRPINYSVVGFGSLAYPDFCRFAFDVDKVLSEKGNMNKRCDIHTIHNQSDQSFQNWYNTWSKEIGISHPLEGIGEKQKATKTKTFIIDKITKPSIDTDQSFVIELKPPNGIRVQSGDLLAVSPSLMDNERLYSIAVLQNGNLLLSVKKHEFGVCSTYLSSLDEGGQIEAFIKSNPAFHLPKNNKSVIMIANGTGIAPFLGMIESNQNALRQMHLFWGGRTMSAWELYSEKINKAMYNNALETFDTAFSRELTPREYVQDIVGLSSEKIVKVLENKGVILICGSISMQKGVISVLDNICNEHTSHSIHFYQNKGQIKMDCY